MPGPKRLRKEKNGLSKVDTTGARGKIVAESRDSIESISGTGHVVAKHRKSSSISRRTQSAGQESKNKEFASQDLLPIIKGPRCSQDLHTGRTIEYKSGLDTFVFPTPSPLLPTSSRAPSRASSPRQSPRLAPRSATFHRSPSDLRRESPKIGMAIGSPSQVQPVWGRSQTADAISSRIQQRPQAPEKPSTSSKGTKQQRAKKTSSWRVFSNLFRKSSKPAPVTKDPFYRLKVEEPQPLPNSSTDLETDPHTGMPPLSSGHQHASPGLSSQFHSRTPSDAQVPPRCESRGSVRTSFTRLMRSPCDRTTPSPSPWRGTFFRGERDPKNPPTLHSQSAAVSRTPRLELNLPAPEMERYSVMFSQLLSPVPSNDSRPSLLERRLSRLPTAARTDNDTTVFDVQSTTSLGSQGSRGSANFTRTLSIRVDGRRNTSTAPATAPLRPRPVMRAQTAPIFEASHTMASSPESRTGSASHSEASLATPTTHTTCTDVGSVHRVTDEKEPNWSMLASQPVIVSSPDVTQSRLDHHSVDLERQMVQVSVARQVSINRARSRVRRTVSTKQPKMVDLVTARNRKSEVGILDSVDMLGDAGDEEMPGNGWFREFS